MPPPSSTTWSRPSLPSRPRRRPRARARRPRRRPGARARRPGAARVYLAALDGLDARRVPELVNLDGLAGLDNLDALDGGGRTLNSATPESLT